MADINQVYEIVNELAKQSLGLSDVTATEAGFISVGKEVLKSDATIDAWNKALADRIGKTAICIREYEGNDGGIRKEGIDFGIALQRIYIDLVSASKNTTWESAKDAHSDPFRKNSPTVSQKIFSKLSTWEYDLSVPDRQLKTAFTNATAMGAFFSGLYTALHNSVEIAYENTANLCRAKAITTWYTAGNAVNLLHTYNTDTNRSLTVSDALKDKEFLRYASYIIKLTLGRHEKISTLFNPDKRKTFTSRDKAVLTVLNDYSSAAEFYLESDSYHRDLVKLPGYRSVPYWQGSGATYDLQSVSTVAVKNGDVSTTVPYVIATLFDWDAMGVTLEDRRIKVVRNDADEYTTHFAKADIGYYIDPAFNGTVFYLAEA